MKQNALWGLMFLVLIFAGVAIWAFAGDPVVQNDTATTTSQGSDADVQAGPLTPAQLEARVVVDVPVASSTVAKEFTVSGKVPGPWYFEASFPIELRSATGTVLAVAVAQAEGDWMTTNDVPFTASFSTTYKGPATLRLIRDNPSGLPENDASVSVSIVIN